MKIYALSCSSGEYEDYREWQQNHCLSKEKAEKHLQEYNEKLEIKMNRVDKCRGCKMSEGEKPKNPIKCYKGKEVIIDFYRCENQAYMFDLDKSPAQLIEIDVEE